MSHSDEDPTVVDLLEWLGRMSPEEKESIPSCDTCKYRYEVTEGVSECRRNAPTPFVGTTEQSVFASWPIIEEGDDFCGEYSKGIGFKYIDWDEMLSEIMEND